METKELMEYGYEDAYQGSSTYSLDTGGFSVASLQRNALSMPSLIALALFLGVAYYVYHQVEKPNTALLVGAGAWLIFVIITSMMGGNK
jgi:uncharacterized membrane protein (GlpM family)